MDTLTIDGTHVAPILVRDRRKAIEPVLVEAGVTFHRWGNYMADRFVLTYVHLCPGDCRFHDQAEPTDPAVAAEAIASLGWRNTTIQNVAGMLAIETTI